MEIPQTKRCVECHQLFTLDKKDDSGYIAGKPYCETCRLEVLDWC